MNPAQLLAHFDRIGEVPDAIPRLRRFILDLAVRGKLVEQDPRDGPTSELLKKIAEARELKAAAATIKRQSPLPLIEPKDEPFTVPVSWRWVRLNELTELVYGKLLPTSELLSDGYDVFGANGIIGKYSGYLYEYSMLLISCRGAYSGTPNISPPRCYITNNSIICELFDHNSCEIRYLHSVLSVSPREKIVTGTAQPQVTVANAIKLPIPLPPLAEQHRIVAKVDELMALCDRLEAAQRERENRRDRLVASSLHHLSNGADANAFREHARFYFNHLPRLITRRDHIKQLRQTILNLAVRGKLVKQDPTDEPASELLKRIQAEKKRLVKEGILKKEKPQPEIDENSLPFLIPGEWIWTRFGELTELVTKGSSPKWQGIAYMRKNDGILFITSENVDNYQLRKLDELKYVEKRFNEIEPRSILRFGDILMNLVGASIGRTAIYNLKDGANINQAVALIRLLQTTQNLSTQFLLHYLNGPSAIQIMLASQVVTAQPNISLTNVREFPIPVPPLAEQHRIVAKVDEIMALCDQLETQLNTTQTASQKLMEAILGNLLTA